MTVKVVVKNTIVWAQIDTAARSIWVNKEWFIQQGGVIIHNDNQGANAVDGRDIEVEGTGYLNLGLWGCMMKETVRVMKTLPSLMLIGRNFWWRYALRLDMGIGIGRITYNKKHYEGKIKQDTKNSGRKGEYKEDNRRRRSR